ncbi:hypothetical protein [Cronobacter dublinensis]|uniref:hypothetical protein n=1 Tax=Cronobacter dublinensis TaxID=413497 RepID=UPI00300E3121
MAQVTKKRVVMMLKRKMKLINVNKKNITRSRAAFSRKESVIKQTAFIITFSSEKNRTCD